MSLRTSFLESQVGRVLLHSGLPCSLPMGICLASVKTGCWTICVFSLTQRGSSATPPPQLFMAGPIQNGLRSYA